MVIKMKDVPHMSGVGWGWGWGGAKSVLGGNGRCLSGLGKGGFFLKGVRGGELFEWVGEMG